MAKLLLISTHGSENPTRATLPWLLAKGAIEAGQQPQIVLAGDAAILAHKAVADSVQGVGIPPLKELVAFAMEKGVPVFV
jgi:predicted peroxiredoxin